MFFTGGVRKNLPQAVTCPYVLKIQQDLVE